MQSQRKTIHSNWLVTSDDYILRTARQSAIKIGGTIEKPILASDPKATDLKILRFINAAGSTGVQINAVTVRRVKI